MRKLGWAGGVALGVLSLTAARAESPAAPAPDSAIDSETITVYATRSPSKALDYPGQVSVIELEQIRDFNPSTLSEVFQAIPGAQFDSGPRRTGDVPAIRGLSGAGVLIFIDGARQSFLSGHDGRFFIDPELVQAVEVVRGPTSALYGSGALGGVIATRTVTAADYLEADERVGVRVATGYQSVNDEFRAGVTGAWRSADDVYDLLGHFTYRSSGDIELGSGLALPADDRILSSLVKATVRPRPGLELFASWLRYDLDATDPQNPQGANLSGPANPLVFRDAVNDTVQGGVRYAPAGSKLIDLQAVGYYTRNAVEEDEALDPRTTDRAVDTFGFTLDNRSRLSLGAGAEVTFTYGGEYYRDRQDGRDTASANGDRGGVPDARTAFVGLFAQADFALQDLGPLPGALTLIPGVRWDRFESEAAGEAFRIEEGEVSPKVGVTYAPAPWLRVFGAWAEGFRAPSFNEAFADGVHFVVPDLSVPPGPRGPAFVSNLFVGNADLAPERSTTWEAGVGLDFTDVLARGDSFTAKASYYDTDVEDLIGLEVETPAGCFLPQFAAIAPCGTGPAFGNFSRNVNIADARIEGVEVEFGYDAPLYYARGAITTINGVDAASGAFLEGVLTPDTLFFDNGVRIPGTGLRLGARMTFAADFDEVNAPQDRRAGFIIGDLYAVWEPDFAALRGLRLDLGVDNVADADFEVVNAGVSQPGRNYKIALAWRKGF